jgi:hypothetical protein
MRVQPDAIADSPADAVADAKVRATSTRRQLVQCHEA